MSAKLVKSYILNVQLDRGDKRALEQLVKKEKLAKTEVVRRLIREAHKQAANG